MPVSRFILPGCALLIVLAFVTMTRADPDLWGHVRFGGDIIDNATIRVPETYSFTSDRPWINHEWLAEVVMAAAYRAAGAAGLVLLKLLAVAVSLSCIWRIAISDGAGLRASALLTAVALCGILPRTQQVRPQLFSVVCFSVLLLLLRRADKRPAVLWLAPGLFAFWANCHGGWLVGCATFGLWCTARTWTARFAIRENSRSLILVWGTWAASLAATLINPYASGLWRFLADTVGLSRRLIPEWGMVTGSLTTLGVWAIFALLTLVALRRSDRPRLSAMLIPVFWGVAAFKVSRLDSFFALSTAGFLAPELVRLIERQRRDQPRRPASRSAAIVMGVVSVATLVATVPMLKANLLCIDVHAASTLPESDGMTFVRDHRLAGRMVTFFDWGQYAIWHKPADLRVSMDGRRETVYSEKNVDLHLDMYLALDDGLAYLDSLRADYVWVPRELPISTTLAQSAMWTTVYRSDRSIIFARSSLVVPGTPVQEGAAVQCRCFPGP